MHNHTSYSSACSILDNHLLIERAKKLGLDALCVTEHNTMKGAWEAQRLGLEMDMLVLPAQEVRTLQGDILCFGIYEEGLMDIDTQELIALSRECGGVLIPAHPYRMAALALRDQVFHYPDAFCALEGLNGNCDKIENHKAAEAASKLNIPVIGGSDAHSEKMVGRYYTRFPEKISSTDELLSALKAGGYWAEENPLYHQWNHERYSEL